MNSRLDEIQAAILRVKLRHLERWNERRRQIAESYRRLLAGCEVGLPAADLHGRQVYHQFVIRSENRDLLQSFLADRSIGTAVHYPVPVHLQPAFTDLGHRPGDFPVTEQLSQQVLSLPIYPELPDDSVEAVCRAIREFSSNPARGASGPAQ
jgi:dTDP-4-amino-4,6-dideoxygalactose transaminase